MFSVKLTIFSWCMVHHHSSHCSCLRVGPTPKVGPCSGSLSYHRPGISGLNHKKVNLNKKQQPGSIIVTQNQMNEITDNWGWKWFVPLNWFRKCVCVVFFPEDGFEFWVSPMVKWWCSHIECFETWLLPWLSCVWWWW